MRRSTGVTSPDSEERHLKPTSTLDAVWWASNLGAAACLGAFGLVFLAEALGRDAARGPNAGLLYALLAIVTGGAFLVVGGVAIVADVMSVRRGDRPGAVLALALTLLGVAAMATAPGAVFLK